MNGKEMKSAGMLTLNNWKIGTKIVGLVVLILIISVTSLAVYNYIVISKSTIEQTGETLNDYGDLVLLRSVDVVNKNIAGLKALALTPLIIEAAETANNIYVGQSREDIDAYMAQMDKAWKDEDPNIDSIVKSVADNSVSEHLKSFLQTFPDEVEVFVTDINGLNVAMTDRTSDYMQSDEGWWQNAYNNGAGAVSVTEVEYDESSKIYAMNIGIPIRDKSGSNIIGVLRGTVNISALFTDLSLIKFGETGSAALLDKQGNILFAQNSNLLMQSAPEPILQIVAQGKNGWSQDMNDLDGNPAIVSYNFISGDLAQSLGWIILLEQDLSEVQTPVRNAMLGNVIMAIIVAVLLSIIGSLLSSMISKPIMRVAEYTEQLAVGNTELEAKDQTYIQNLCTRGDELGVTGRALDNLLTYFSEMGNVAEQIADGNLTVMVYPKSEKDMLGTTLKKMVVSLRQTINQVAHSSNTVERASSQLAAAANQAGQVTNHIAITVQQVANGTAQQSESVTHTASSVEEMARAINGVAMGAQEQSVAISKASNITSEISNDIQQVAGNVAAVTKDSAATSDAANRGSKMVEDTIDGMQTIKTKVDFSSKKVQEMGQRSEQIGVIVETIEDIASQTNLLALNAAIEAARAGEHGKGFAVVADEVRKLAERSSSATKEIGALIKGIQATVSDAVTAMQESAQEVEAGVSRADQSGQALNDILTAAQAVLTQAEEAAKAAVKMSTASDDLVASMDSVSAVVEENTAATEQLAAGSNEVSQAIEKIATISEENSAAIEEVSSSAEEMSAQVEEVTASAQSLAEMARALQQVVSRFKIDATVQPEQQSHASKSDSAHLKPEPDQQVTYTNPEGANDRKVKVIA